MTTWMYQRKSCRSYQPIGVDQSVFAEIEQTKSRFQFPHHQAFDYSVVLVEEGALIQSTFTGLISRYVAVKAPHYLMLSCAPQQHDAFLIGFLGECFVRRLTELGLGTCWVGHHLDRDKALSLGMPDHHDYKIIIAFGYPDSEAALAEKKHKRKTLGQLGYGGDASDLWLYQALQLAPSAVNTQPWKLVHHDGQYHYLLSKNHLLSALLRDKNAIDMGIGFYHLYDAIKARGFRMSWDFGSLGKEGPSSVLHFKFFE